MKKRFFTILALMSIMASATAQDQKIYVCKKDGSFVEYEIASVDSITFNKPQSNENPNEEMDPKVTMQQLRDDLVERAPSVSGSYGKTEHKTYFSTTANKEKGVNVQVPDNYDPSKKYPVLFVLHGIMGSENDLTNGFTVSETIADALGKGKIREMIVVYPQMFTSKTMNSPSGINLEVTKAYDAFQEDIKTDLIPWLKENYSVAEGRENMAITGFSMGGREALYIGTQNTDIFGYVGGACPAPGITPGQDMYMNHPGTIPNEADFKIPDGKPLPYILLISGGTNDSTVGNFPESYHNILTTNGVDHVWHKINGTGHGPDSVGPHMYNFINHIFPAK